MLAELVNGDHWRIGKDVAIRVHAEPRKREYNMMADGDLPDGFHDSGFATVRKTLDRFHCFSKGARSFRTRSRHGSGTGLGATEVFHCTAHWRG